ncbi:helix-turn-helix transcriptional regulator [Cryobacterium sp. TMS1-13-1]|uniref:helix-turn-helix domain-containing protein n=1 Tax=Cryobacterium sp. TMS1-13-1 TaxID=1259220 RepID=UPI00106A279A|nr:helix-turn-helix transcriptional regulator [Cryobacterium sp. TMS1-13-1]TFD23008.1 XRE family transcriptional regulator [Cryobacterium sp. TMS1-13-1]
MIAQIRSAVDLGDFTRRIRLQHGMTQRQLAVALGTTQRYVSELEAGKPKRADERYFEILARLGIALSAQSTSPVDDE